MAHTDAEPPTETDPDATPDYVRVVPASGKYHAPDCWYGQQGANTRDVATADARANDTLAPAECCLDTPTDAWADDDTLGTLDTVVDLAAQREKLATIESNIPAPDPSYTPTPSERLLLAILADEGKATSRVIRMRGGFEATFASEMLGRLADHGWVWRLERPDENEYGNVKEVTGFYQYNAPAAYDPDAGLAAVASYAVSSTDTDTDN